MELGENVVALNFQNLFHSDEVSEPSRSQHFSIMVSTRRKLHILIGAHIIKQLKAGCPGCEIQGKVFFIIKYMCILFHTKI